MTSIIVAEQQQICFLIELLFLLLSDTQLPPHHLSLHSQPSGKLHRAALQLN